MATELNTAQLRLQGVIKDVNKILVNNKVNVFEMDVIFQKIKEYHTSLAFIKPVGEIKDEK